MKCDECIKRKILFFTSYAYNNNNFWLKSSCQNKSLFLSIYIFNFELIYGIFLILLEIILVYAEKLLGWVEKMYFMGRLGGRCIMLLSKIKKSMFTGLTCVYNMFGRVEIAVIFALRQTPKVLKVFICSPPPDLVFFRGKKTRILRFWPLNSGAMPKKFLMEMLRKEFAKVFWNFFSKKVCNFLFQARSLKIEKNEIYIRTTIFTSQK